MVPWVPISKSYLSVFKHPVDMHTGVNSDVDFKPESVFRMTLRQKRDRLQPWQRGR